MAPRPRPPAKARPANPFLADLEAKEPMANPFATDTPGEPVPDTGRGRRRAARQPVRAAAGREARGRVGRAAQAPAARSRAGRRGVSYAKVLLRDDVPAVYAQFGPLTAYPRAQRTRDLYPALPDAPLPAVITCIATTAEARGAGLARTLVAAVCDDLAERGFTAVETYPTIGAEPDATSAATPAFWLSVGFALAIDDERFPVMRRDLA